LAVYRVPGPAGLAEFSFQTAELDDQHGDVDVEGDGGLAEAGVAAGLGEAVEAFPGARAGDRWPE
jgi:hypothetical protein